MNRKYYFEFVGAHNAGKTSIYHAIAKEGLLSPYVARYPGQMKRPWLHFAFCAPVIAVKNFHHLFFVIGFFFRYAKWESVNIYVLRILLKMIILHPYYDRFDFDVFLKDDMLHFLARVVFKDGVDIEAAFREYFVHFAHLYDGLVFVDVPFDVMRERFEARFKKRSEAFIKGRTVIHERAWHQNQVLKKIVTLQTSVPYLVLDGTEDVSENARKVCVFIKTKILRTN